jgi:hypothetical protein
VSEPLLQAGAATVGVVTILVAIAVAAAASFKASLGAPRVRAQRAWTVPAAEREVPWSRDNGDRARPSKLDYLRQLFRHLIRGV